MKNTFDEFLRKYYDYQEEKEGRTVQASGYLFKIIDGKRIWLDTPPSHYKG